jgi:hypothetical protein
MGSRFAAESGDIRNATSMAVNSVDIFGFMDSPPKI